MQALLKMVGSYSTAALSPSRRDALTESPLRIVLFALRKMCDHAICRNFLRSSELLPVIVHLRQSPNLMLSEYENVIATTVSQAPDVSLGRRKFKESKVHAKHDQATAAQIYDPSAVAVVM